MKALLLNSGIGKRMGDLTKDRPKCMVEIGAGYTIISWQLHLLQQCGIREAVITTGPFADTLCKYVESLNTGMDIQFVVNPEYETTNYICSIEYARDLLLDDILLLHGDLVIEKSVIAEFAAESDSCVAVDSGLLLPEKDFKAQLVNGRVRAIGVEYFGADCVACQPLYHMRKQDMLLWLEEIARFCGGGQRGVYAEKALNNITNSMDIKPAELYGRLCHEIDNADDLAAVSTRFLKTLAEERTSI